MEKDLVLCSKSYDHDGNVVEVCITLDHEIAKRMANKAAKNVSGRATDGALTARVSPQYRKQAKEAYHRRITLNARREDAVLRLLLHAFKEHDLNA